jgi:uncharacterized membrane protein YidH (DUF202 family)
VGTHRTVDDQLRLHDLQGSAGIPGEPGAHHRPVGLFLVGLGTFSMVLGTIEFWQSLKDLRRLEEIKIWRPSFLMAVIISVAGLSMFVSIVMRVV